MNFFTLFKLNKTKRLHAVEDEGEEGKTADGGDAKQETILTRTNKLPYSACHFLCQCLCICT